MVNTSTIVEKDLPHTMSARWKLGDVLGEGGYSIVKVGTNKVTNEKAAVKIVSRIKISTEDEESLLDEVKILKSLDHPNVTRIFDFFEEKTHFYVVMELLEGGELFDRIVQKQFYNEKDARDLVLLLLNTIKYLHDRNIIHRYPRYSLPSPLSPPFSPSPPCPTDLFC